MLKGANLRGGGGADQPLIKLILFGYTSLEVSVGASGDSSLFYLRSQLRNFTLTVKEQSRK